MVGEIVLHACRHRRDRADILPMPNQRGPKTEEGKVRSRMNALNQGLHSLKAMERSKHGGFNISVPAAKLFAEPHAASS